MVGGDNEAEVRLAGFSGSCCWGRRGRDRKRRAITWKGEEKVENECCGRKGKREEGKYYDRSEIENAVPSRNSSHDMATGAERKRCKATKDGGWEGRLE